MNRLNLALFQYPNLLGELGQTSLDIYGCNLKY